MRRPPAMFCRECGGDMGRGWQQAPLCESCKPATAQADDCLCNRDTEPLDPSAWNPRCPIHTHNPYDIPF